MSVIHNKWHTYVITSYIMLTELIYYQRLVLTIVSRI